MKIADILATKGGTVHTIRAWKVVHDVVEQLDRAGVGALLVLDESDRIAGIVSERDLVRGLRRHGTLLLGRPVTDVMTRQVRTCTSEETVAHAMATMTDARHRHLPVVDGGKLVGLVSIGDLVKHRVAEIELERGVLRDAAIARY